MQQQQPLPVPDYFQFQWDSPDEAARFWSVDLMHWPRGLSNLSATMVMPAFYRGATTAAQELCMPLARLGAKHIRGYVYHDFAPYSTDPAEMAARTAAMMSRMAEHVPGLLERWRTRYEPEARATNERVRSTDYRGLGDADLADALDGIIQDRERQGELHFLAVFPAMAAVSIYEQVYADLFGVPAAEEHLQLLQGFPNKSLEVGTALWRLALEARQRPLVLEVLRREAPSAVHAALATTPDGMSFRDAVEEFLDTYGWRGADMDLAAETWVEDPAPVYLLLREYAAREDYNPEDELKSLAAAREARQRMLLDKLNGGGETAAMFGQVLAGAQQYLPIQEDHNFRIDQEGIAVSRLPALEAGRRLAADGRLADHRDVFFLKVDELQEALRDPGAGLRDLVAQRKREQEENRRLTPPPALGTPPADSAPGPSNKFFGATPPANPDPRLLNGNAASAGKVTGTARVIPSMDDADRLGRGEILVCPATMPVWTPLFAIASAVVTDHGGVLSHTAIVAREYQIPAVVGTKVGTSLIRDGQLITVDGTAGTVRLEA